MSIRINNQTIAGNYEHKPTSYRYVGEIFQSAIPIEDIKVACLDGHKIYSDEGYGSFIQHLISQSVLYPQLTCTEEEWQEKVAQYGSWGKFVINTQENSVRLPKITGFIQGLSSLENLANLIEAGLPNITGKIEKNDTALPLSNTDYFDFSGALKTVVKQTTKPFNEASSSSANRLTGIEIDASSSNSIYGNSDTVQPQSVQYPYYIVLATGVIQTINVKEDVELNNPFFLGQSEYFENTPNNLSWLKSEGQWNSKAVYPDYYNWLLNIYNGIDQQDGVSVKAHTDTTITDYDFVINTSDETFRLPLKNGEENLPSAVFEEMTLGATDTSYIAQSNGWVTMCKVVTATGQYIQIVAPSGTEPAKASSSSDWLYATKEVKRGDTYKVQYTASGETKFFRFNHAVGNGDLYYYVGETVQNVNLINAGRIEEKIASLLPQNKSLITEYNTPDLTGATHLSTSPTNNSTYTATKDGLFCVYGISTETASSIFLSINSDHFTSNLTRVSNCFGANRLHVVFIPASKNDVVYLNYTAVKYTYTGYSNLGLWFIPKKGAQ